MKITAHVVLVFAFLFTTVPVYSDVPLEDPSFAEGIKAIRDMHGLNLLGLTGDLITIFIAGNEASKAAEIFYQNKWRPGDDDLGWVDRQRTPQKKDPFGGLKREDRKRWDSIWGKIKYLQNLVTPYSTTAEKEEISQAIRTQISHLNRILADYRDIVEQVGFVNGATNCISFAGSWYSDKYKETVNLEQSGNKLSGTCDTPNFTHGISGTVSGNKTTFNITRTNRNSGCTTVMFATAELLNNCSKLRRVISSTDGKCDLRRSFTNEVIYDLNR